MKNLFAFVAAASTSLLSVSALSFGQFSAPTPVLSVPPGLTDAALLDWDLDGDEDLVGLIRTPTNGFELYGYERQSDGTYGAGLLLGASNQRAWTLAIHDFDQDGFEDILVSALDSSSGDIYWAKNQAGQSFGALTGLFSTPIYTAKFAFEDLTGNGQLDLVWLGHTTLGLREALGGGLYSSSIVTSLPHPVSGLIHFLDLDGDPSLDLIIGTDSSSVSMWIEFDPNNGVIVRPTLPGLTGPTVSVDFDADGDEDLITVDLATATPNLLENQGGGMFGNSTYLTSDLFAHSATSIDIDGDGDREPIFHSSVMTGVVWLDNLGTGTLQPTSIPMSPSGGQVLLVSDHDSDGAQDLLVHDSANDRIVWIQNQSTLGMISCVATANSTGVGAQLHARGTVEAGENRVQLQLTQAPPGQFGMLVNSKSAGQSTPLGSSGTLCLASPLGRYNRVGEYGMISLAGELSFTLDLTDTPGAMGSTLIQAGETWYFQAWHRDQDPGPTTHFSDAIMVQFL